MTPPIRPEVHALAEFPKEPGQMTCREAIEWYKTFYFAGIGAPTPLEKSFINQRWGVLMEAISKREGIGAGALSYLLDSVARSEINLIETGAQEAAAALPDED